MVLYDIGRNQGVGGSLNIVIGEGRFTVFIVKAVNVYWADGRPNVHMKSLL